MSAGGVSASQDLFRDNTPPPQAATPSLDQVFQFFRFLDTTLLVTLKMFPHCITCPGSIVVSLCGIETAGGGGGTEGGGRGERGGRGGRGETTDLHRHREWL